MRQITGILSYDLFILSKNKERVPNKEDRDIIKEAADFITKVKIMETK